MCWNKQICIYICNCDLISFKSLWPDDTIRNDWTGLSLVHGMACRQLANSIKIRHFSQGNAFDNVICKTTSILFSLQCIRLPAPKNNRGQGFCLGDTTSGDALICYLLSRLDGQGVYTYGFIQLLLIRCNLDHPDLWIKRPRVTDTQSISLERIRIVSYSKWKNKELKLI